MIFDVGPSCREAPQGKPPDHTDAAQSAPAPQEKRPDHTDDVLSTEAGFLLDSISLSSALDVACAMWFQHMSTAVLVKWRQGMQKFITTFGPEIPYGTGCSGSDVLVHVLGVLEKHWQAIFNMEVQFVQKFACEKNPEKQTFIMSQHHVPMILESLSLLSSDKAKNLVSGEIELVPYVMLFACGFPCTSRTSMSVNAKLNKHCCQKGTEATGSGFVDITKYLAKCQPLIVVLENIPALLEAGPEETSDAEHIVKEMEKLGYTTTYFRFDCEEFGSVARRDRLYFVGFHSSTKGDFSWGPSREMMSSMKICRLGVESFICLSAETNDTNLQLVPVVGNSAQPAKKKCKGDCAYKDEHLAVYGLFGMTWPPSPRRLPGYLNTDTLTPRQVELALLVDKAWPHHEKDGVQFIDSNLTLSRMLSLSPDKTAESVRSPWSNACPTLTSHSKIIVRYNHEDSLVVRALEGYEVMSLIGWDLAHWRMLGEDKRVEGDLCSSLAGNAFSAFAVGPILVVALSAMGCLSTVSTSGCSPEDKFYEYSAYLRKFGSPSREGHKVMTIEGVRGVLVPGDPADVAFGSDNDVVNDDDVTGSDNDDNDDDVNTISS